MSHTTYPIAVMSFDRPNYLRRVLQSLANQSSFQVKPDNIFLFQDNYKNAYSGLIHGNRDDIDRSIAVFQEFFPKGHVLLAENNLGVCENFLRAETLFFNNMKADVGLFFEDDMELAPTYLKVMNTLAKYALENEKIGYFAAYGNYKLGLDQQETLKKNLTRLGHHWAFGLTRRHWDDLNKWLAPYYDMVVGRDYRQRPTPLILDYYRSQGIPLGVSSQDDVKKTGTYILNRVSINTNIVSAKYIGETGLHMRPEKFKSAGFGETLLFEGEIPDFNFPSEAECASMVATELRNRQRSIDSSATNLPKKPVTEQLGKPDDNAKSRSQVSPHSDIPRGQPSVENTVLLLEAEQPARAVDITVPSMPHMPPVAQDRLNAILKSSRCFLEFGAGGSTRLAASLNVPYIISVESDKEFATAVRTAVEATQTQSVLTSVYIDIGPTKMWGSPVNNDKVHCWPQYPLKVWELLREKNLMPDFVLIDGRFRVACALATILNTPPGTMFMVDDYVGRERGYQLITKHVSIQELITRCALFKTPERVDYRELATDLAKSCVILS